MTCPELLICRNGENPADVERTVTNTVPTSAPEVVRQSLLPRKLRYTTLAERRRSPGTSRLSSVFRVPRYYCSSRRRGRRWGGVSEGSLHERVWRLSWMVIVWGASVPVRGGNAFNSSGVRGREGWETSAKLPLVGQQTVT